MIKNILNYRVTKGFLLILFGVVSTILVLSAIQVQYESRLIAAFDSERLNEVAEPRTQALLLMDQVHSLLRPRLDIFKEDALGAKQTLFFNTFSFQFNTALGACGAYSHVLTRVLLANGITARLGQMECELGRACHIFVEAYLDGRWVYLDPTFNLAFPTSDKRLATFAELQERYSRYQQILPEEFPVEYTFTDVHYTNWEKIPVVLPAIHAVIKSLLGEQARTISLRMWVLDFSKVLLVLSSIGWIALLSLLIFALRQERPKTKEQTEPKHLSTLAHDAK